MDFLPIADQLARYLEMELRKGRWIGKMPGRDRLAWELAVNRKTVERALGKLEERGVLSGQGAGRRREILLKPVVGKNLRIEILPYESHEVGQGYLISLRHRLREAGHLAGFSRCSLQDLGMDPVRVAAHVDETPADAWVVVSGSREVLESFVTRSQRAFAIFGRRRGLPLPGAGPDKVPVMRQLVKRLIGLGHRRMVMLCRAERRHPIRGTLETTFLREMQRAGIETGPYHLPDWEETPDGLAKCIDGLFGVTPPTAIIVDEAFFLGVAWHHLARLGVRVPEDVSLVCQDPDPSFDWYLPRVSHISWDPEPVVRAAVRWANNLAAGGNSSRQWFTKARFVDGGTISQVF